MTESRHLQLNQHPHLHKLEVRRITDDFFTLNSNGRCLGFDGMMFEELFEAIKAILGGSYDVASTETFDRLEFEKQHVEGLKALHPTTRPPAAAVPGLDDL
jgi:hypothetical protein